MFRSSIVLLLVTVMIWCVAETRADKDKHHAMIHNHLSRKVMDRACAASKDAIDEIVACFTNNKEVNTSENVQLAQACHKEAFGADFNPADMQKHKEEVCQHKDKFEEMTACVYRETAKAKTQKEIEKLSEALVDMGLCIINALDS